MMERVFFKNYLCVYKIHSTFVQKPNKAHLAKWLLPQTQNTIAASGLLVLIYQPNLGSQTDFPSALGELNRLFGEFNFQHLHLILLKLY